MIDVAVLEDVDLVGVNGLATGLRGELEDIDLVGVNGLAIGLRGELDTLGDDGVAVGLGGDAGRIGIEGTLLLFAPSMTNSGEAGSMMTIGSPGIVGSCCSRLAGIDQSSLDTISGDAFDTRGGSNTVQFHRSEEGSDLTAAATAGLVYGGMIRLRGTRS